MKAWFRGVAAAFGAPAPAQTFAGLMLLVLVLYTGYAIPKPSMIGALKWISYINVSARCEFALLNLIYATIADTLWLRGAYLQRVPYTKWNMLKLNTERSWI
jgi:hypothetical protein